MLVLSMSAVAASAQTFYPQWWMTGTIQNLLHKEVGVYLLAAMIMTEVLRLLHKLHKQLHENLRKGRSRKRQIYGMMAALSMLAVSIIHVSYYGHHMIS